MVCKIIDKFRKQLAMYAKNHGRNIQEFRVK